MAMLEKARPDLAGPIAAGAWKRDWVAWCKPWGKGQKAILEYLARYVHRIAISTGRILAMDERTVTFRYKDRKAGGFRQCMVSGHEFMRRFLQHVPPKGFHKVRYYGLWHASRRAQRENIRNALLLKLARQAPPSVPDAVAVESAPAVDGMANPPCPHCGGTDTRCMGTVLKESKTRRTRASP